MQNVRLHSSPRDLSRNPVLSLIMCARNDQYQGNSRWRLETALNYVGKNVHELGIEKDVEVIVADWGSEIPLRNVLYLTPAAAKIVSFVLVPPQIALVEQKDSPFPEVLALNAAARRANGEYIGRIDQDTLVGKHFLKTFFWLYEKRRLLVPLDSAVLLSNRRRIPYRFAVRCPSFWVVDRFIGRFGPLLPLMEPPPPHLYYQSYIGILLFHRNLWYACGGYDERFMYMDYMEFDIVLRLTQKYTFVNSGELVNHDFYHLDHNTGRGFNRARKENPVRDIDNLPEEFHPNDKDWGLNEYSLEVLPYSRERPVPEAEKVNRFQSNWIGFTLVVLSTGASMAWDSLSVQLNVSRRFLTRCSYLWKVRAGVARDTVYGQPLRRWPGLLSNLWTEKLSRRRQRKRNHLG